MNKVKKWSRIFSYILLSVISLGFGVGSIYNVYVDEDIKKGIGKCGMPSMEQISYVQEKCPDQKDGLRCSLGGEVPPPPCEHGEKNGNCLNYEWIPIHEGKSAIWHLSSVLTWFRKEKHYAINESLLDVAKANMQLNIAKESSNLDPSIHAEICEFLP